MDLPVKETLTYSQYGVPKYSQRFRDVLYRVQNQPLDKKEQKQQINYQFHRIKLLGIGAHSMVNIVLQDQTRALYAQKIIKKQEKVDLRQLCDEIRIHLYLSHPNLIQLYHCYHDSEAVYLLMELGIESLFAMKNRKHTFKLSEILKIMNQIVSAIGYMHTEGLVHGDLKLENIVMSADENVKLCDFGYTHKLYKPASSEIVGTLEYLPPEYVQSKDSGFKRDIWAIGIILYELLTGQNPLDGLAQDQKWLTLLKFQQQKSREWIPQNIPQCFKQIIKATLCKQSKRATWKQIQQILEDAHFPNEEEVQNQINLANQSTI